MEAKKYYLLETVRNSFPQKQRRHLVFSEFSLQREISGRRTRFYVLGDPIIIRYNPPGSPARLILDSLLPSSKPLRDSRIGQVLLPFIPNIFREKL